MIKANNRIILTRTVRQMKESKNREERGGCARAIEVQEIIERACLDR